MPEPQGKLTFREQMRGFPVWQIFVISIIRFAEPVAFTSLFPFVYFMIRDFGIAKNKADIATYSGYLSASFAFFQFLCCVQWGRASDRVGRKRILLMGLFGTAASMTLFGFSPNFYVAVFARSAMGCLNGNIAVLRTAIGEIATERRHQAMAFSTLPLLWNIGAVVGPMIGGSKYLTRPKTDPDAIEPNDLFIGDDSVYERFITKFPYALSSIVVASFLLFSLVVGVLFLEESHPKFKNRRDRGLEIGDAFRRFIGVDVPLRPWQRPKKSKAPVYNRLPTTSSSNTDVIDIDSDNDNDNEIIPFNQPQQLYASTADEVVDSDESSDSIASNEYMSRRMSEALVRRYSSTQLGPVISSNFETESIITTNAVQGFNREIFTAPVLQTIVANFLTSFHNIVYAEFLPVLLAGDLLVDEIKFPFTLKGGFGFESSSIGTLLSSTGLVGGLGIMFIFPIIDRNFKTINAYRVSALIFPFTYAILPYLVFTLHSYNPNYSPGLTKKLLYTLCCCNSFCGSVGFPNILILIHRASPAKHRAFINGSALSLSSLARFIGPILFGYIMSVTNKYSIGEVAWFLLSLVAIVCVVQAFFMKDYDEDLKDDEQV
ncbi:major facilitator superfamily domain-containing protein [Scheffersomyces amazonensis]|uniref:major facilitator superfamily domain-containing protein n=1 Tax=Scheffersomyces amazonensis TaxID=1078765 RepID=UPI00315DCB72